MLRRFGDHHNQVEPRTVLASLCSTEDEKMRATDQIVKPPTTPHARARPRNPEKYATVWLFVPASVHIRIQTPGGRPSQHYSTWTRYVAVLPPNFSRTCQIMARAM